MTEEDQADYGVEDSSAEPVEPSRRLPSDETLAAIVSSATSATYEEPADDEISVQVSKDEYISLVRAAWSGGFDAFVDLCGVDYYRRNPRYEVVLSLLNQQMPHRMRIRVGVGRSEPCLPSVTEVFPGANFYERETYDLFGIEFTGHPDLTRILLPDEWEGHPLRKDYAVGAVPVQFKEAPRAR